MRAAKIRPSQNKRGEWAESVKPKKRIDLVLHRIGRLGAWCVPPTAPAAPTGRLVGLGRVALASPALHQDPRRAEQAQPHDGYHVLQHRQVPLREAP